MWKKYREKFFYSIVIVLVILNIILVGVNIAILIGSAQQDLLRNSDFTSFYTAFSMVKSGEAAKLYDLNTQAIYQQRILAGYVFKDGVLPYLNPPFIAFIFSPLAFLPRNIAFVIWIILQFSLLTWLVLLLSKLTRQWSKPERQLLLLLLLSFWPLSYTILLGQFSLIILIGFVQVYISLKTSKLHNAGIWLASLFMIKPQVVLLPAVMTLTKRYFRVLLIMGSVCLLIIAISSLFIGWAPWKEYIGFIPQISNYFNKFGLIPGGEYTFRGILSMIFGNSQMPVINTFSSFILVFGMVIVWFLWRRGKAEEQPGFQLCFALTLTLSAFLNLHSNSYDCLILVFPAVLLYDYLRWNSLPRLGYSIFLLCSPLFFILDVFYKISIFGIFRPPVIIVIIFLAWVIYYLPAELRSKRIVSPVP